LIGVAAAPSVTRSLAPHHRGLITGGSINVQSRVGTQTGPVRENQH
jgi:hypothetical protein